MAESEDDRSAAGGRGLPAPAAGAAVSSGSGPETEAFEAFYRSYFSRLVAFLLFQGSSEGDAADIAQDTMIKLFGRWRTVQNPSAWANVVASRELIRRRTDDKVVSKGEVIQQAVIREGADLGWAEQHEVLRLLRLLPARQRQVLAWTFDGYSPEEIARHLGIAAATVRANLYKARRSLATHLAEGKGRE